jgi:hypothetical protein
VSRSKCKRCSLQLPDGAGPSFVSPNQFAVLSDSESDAEDIGVSSQPSSRKSRIPPIVIYSYLNNHSATLKKINETLSTPVDVKSCHTSSYCIQNPSQTTTCWWVKYRPGWLSYHTYPLPDAVQPRLVLKGIPPNCPVDEIQADLKAQELGAVKITQITKTDKSHTNIYS